MARDAEPYISYVPWRRGEWKGHDGPDNVKRVIRANGRDHGLRIFVLTPRHGAAQYVEVSPERWFDLFGA